MLGELVQVEAVCCGADDDAACILEGLGRVVSSVKVKS